MDINFAGVYSCEYLTFDLYFASLASLQVHPGAGTKDHKALSLEECKDKALQMLIIRRNLPVRSNLNEGES